ncbi:hypothetical protein H1R20_g14342, partial [Candolleomyces eurysporus]
MPLELTPASYRKTYSFEEFPSYGCSMEAPVYFLGWLISLPRAVFRIRLKSLLSYREQVLKPRWVELGYATDENTQDGVAVPEVTVFGCNFLLIIVGVNWKRIVDASKRPEVRERILRQTWSLFDLDPKYATAEKLKWFASPAPRNIMKLPNLYPVIYKEDEGATLPGFVTEVIYETWMERIKSYPGQSRIQIENQEESEKKQDGSEPSEAAEVHK